MIKQFKMLLLLLPAIFLEGCTKDILSGQPEWLGNSIYERLSEGITVNVDGVEKHETFETTLKLINSLEQTDVLAIALLNAPIMLVAEGVFEIP